MTTGQRWRKRRNIAIAIAHKWGFSQRILADVFDLPRSRVAEIVAEVTDQAGELVRRPELSSMLPSIRATPKRAGRATASR